MHETVYGRALMGDSLGFHILFALLGVGVPLLISLAEFIGLWRKDNEYYLMARRWSFTLATLFVAGAASGMIISNQMSVLWPKFMAITGQVVGPAFYLETFAFFIEAIFLGIYLYSWDRFKNRWTHWLCSLPIVLGSAASAFFITSANAWMNAPQGFLYKNGEVSDVNPLRAMFNPATFSETTHSIVSYYLTTALFFAGMYAFFLWRGRRKITLAPQIHARRNYYQKAIVFTMGLAVIFCILIGTTGDASGKYLAQQEPLKLAAAEGIAQTTSNAPLRIGGFFDKDDHLEHSVDISGLLSWIAYGSRDAVIKGLDAFDPTLWPPLWIHYMFDLMVGVGILMTGVIFLFFLLYFARRRAAFAPAMLLLLFLTGFTGFFAVEFGWILTEVGRQPYAINGILTTADAFTTSPHVAEFGFIFPSLYLILFILVPWVLHRHYKKDTLDLNKKYL